MNMKELIKHHLGSLAYYAVGKELCEISNQNQELLWARIWDDTCRDIHWTQDLPGLSPGRWAVGYNYIYVMTRILNEMHPHRILDLGLGISSTLISSYIGFYSDKDDNTAYEHIVVEQEPKWIDIYTSNHKLSMSTKIVHRVCKKTTYDGENTFAYEDFETVIKGKKFDVISVDGPWGGERYSRRDIVPFLPDILNDSFVIIIDDTDRVGELDTVHEITEKLDEHGIKYATGVYSGRTDCMVIVSENIKYLCTM